MRFIAAALLIVSLSSSCFGALGDFLYRINPPKMVPGNNFGLEMEIIDDRLVVGSYLAGTAGMAWVFELDGQLISEIDAPPNSPSNSFGDTIAGMGDRIFIGGRMGDEAVVYEFDPNGNHVDTIREPDHSLANFGSYMATTSDSFLVGDGSYDITIFDWDTMQGTEIWDRDGRTLNVVSSPEHDLVVRSVRRDEVHVSVYDDPTEEPLFTLFESDWGPLRSQSWGDWQIATAKDRLLVSNIEENTHVDVFDIHTGELITETKSRWVGGTRGLTGYGENVLHTVDFASPTTKVAMFSGTTGELMATFDPIDFPQFQGPNLAQIIGHEDRVFISGVGAIIDGVPSTGAIYVYEGITPAYFGDVNSDGITDAADLNILATNWLASADGAELGDISGDGIVDAIDLNVVGQNWLQTNDAFGTPVAAPVPESSLSWWLLVLGALLASSARSR